VGTRVLLIRHAESKWVEYADSLPADQKRFGGRMNEVGLSTRGEGQGQRWGDGMRRRRVRPTHYVSSPAARAIQTHTWGQRGMGIDPASPLTIVDDFEEMTWGDWEGELRSVANQARWVRLRRRQQHDFCPPGGESFNMVRARGLAALGGVVRQVPDGSLVCIYTHQNVIKSMVYPWMKWNIDQTMAAKLDVVSATGLICTGSSVSLEFFNRSMVVES